jgi:hypothetical protein
MEAGVKAGVANAYGGVSGMPTGTPASTSS